MTVIVIDGPVASGKSTLARAAASELDRRGVRAATIDLDLVYEMLEHTGAAKDDPAVWAHARRTAVRIAEALLADGVAVVIAEGSYPSRASFPEARRVVLEVPFDVALGRAQADPTRGLSRDEGTLRSLHGGRRTEPGDLTIDTSGRTIADAARAIADLGRQPCEASAMGYVVIDGADQHFAAPSWRPEDPRGVVELRATGLAHSQANLWRYPPGAQGRRHSEPQQEEVFCVVEGTLTAYLGEPPERFEVGPRSVIVVQPRTPLQLRNESDADVVLFAFGAPAQPAEYTADVLPDA